MATLFVTGANGYLGRRVLAQIDPERFDVVALVRSVESLRPRPGLDLIEGDICAPDSYRDRFPRGACVLHLAAVTGKAPRSEYERVNVEGTRALLEVAKGAGAVGFVHVSSIAVSFPDQKSYWYAHSKARSEQAVQQSGIPHCIVRPTMILGPGAPLQESLGKLASAPVIPAFGGGGSRVQPVLVDDLAACLVELAGEARFEGETIEIGGADVVTMVELLRRMRGAPGRVLPVPLAPLRLVLGLLEPLALPVLPLTAGQLASFANDGTAAPHPWTAGRRMRGLDAMLPDRAAAELRAEGIALGRYLAGAAPDDYVLARYADFHARAAGDPAPFDRFLLRVAGGLPFGLRLADVYSARFHKSAEVRRRLVLMLALLECTPAASRVFDAPPRSGRIPTWLDMGLRSGVEAVCLVVATLVFALPHLLLGRKRPDRPEVGASGAP